MHSSFQFVNHRPWPIKPTPWTMSQSWKHLLFAHWPVPADELRKLIPEPLEIDTWDGQGWLGVVPFELTIQPRCTPRIPGFSRFPEINVRTYVTINNRPGVWFFSLDATNRFAVRAARFGFSLPYFDAKMEIEHQGEAVCYVSRRTHRNASAAEFDGTYSAVGDEYEAEVGSLEEWLTERYCLYSSKPSNRILTADVHHKRWQLRRAECDIRVNTMADQVGLKLAGTPMLHFVRDIAVVNWMPESV